MGQRQSICNSNIKRKLAAAIEIQNTLDFLSRWIINDKINDGKCGTELLDLVNIFSDTVDGGASEERANQIIAPTILQKLHSKTLNEPSFYNRFLSVVCNESETLGQENKFPSIKCHDLDAKKYLFTDAVLYNIPEYFEPDSEFVTNSGDNLEWTVVQEFNDFVNAYHNPFHGQSLRDYYEFQTILRKLYSVIKNDLDEMARSLWTVKREACEAFRNLHRLNELTNLLVVLDDMQCRIISPSDNDKHILLISAPHPELYETSVDKELKEMYEDSLEYNVFVRQMQEINIIPNKTPITQWILLQRLIFRDHVSTLFKRVQSFCY